MFGDMGGGFGPLSNSYIDYHLSQSDSGKGGGNHGGNKGGSDGGAGAAIILGLLLFLIGSCAA